MITLACIKVLARPLILKNLKTAIAKQFLNNHNVVWSTQSQMKRILISRFLDHARAYCSYIKTRPKKGRETQHESHN